VFVFLKDGKILNLNRGAAVIDAAFQIHTEVGLDMVSHSFHYHIYTDCIMFTSVYDDAALCYSTFDCLPAHRETL
jgi:TGS domain